MSTDPLEQFMSGIRVAESGSEQGNYSAQNPSGAYGAYQFMPQYWDGWASGAGIAGANIRDPAAQDRVARWLMDDYYQTYGAWDLVATAWRLGPGVANRVQNEGWGALTAQEKAKIDPYLQKVMPYTGTGPYQATGQAGDVDEEGDPILDAGHVLAKMFDGMSRKIAGGPRTSARDLMGTMGSTAVSLQGAGASGGSTGVPDASGFSEEGDEQYPFGDPGASWNSSSTATHTYATNAERLADPAYENIATNVVAPVGQYLATTFGVSLNQHRDLGTRPSGGAEFSDHYWGGALDITGSQEQMNQVAAWAKQYGEQLGINYTLWQVPNHYDHVHISWLPPASAGAVHDPATALLQSGIVQVPKVNMPTNVIPSTGAQQEPIVVPEGVR